MTQIVGGVMEPSPATSHETRAEPIQDPGRWRFLLAACSVAAAVTLMGASADGVDPPASAPGAGAHGYSLDGDPAAPDVSGLWLQSYTAAPGEIGQVPREQNEITRWAPWPPPLTPPYQKIATQRLADQKAGRYLGDREVHCVPVGNPRALTSLNFSTEIIQTPGEVGLWFWGQLGGQMIVWTDGRPHPKDLKPTEKGHSIGYWLGDTLYVDTVGIDASTPVDSGWRTPHSGALHMQWTMQRVAKDTLHVHVTLYDAQAFTEPMVTTDIWRRKSGPGWEMLDDDSCFENNHNLPGAANVPGFLTF